MNKCPICEKNNIQHRLSDDGRIKTLLGGDFNYYEDGVFHCHDPNTCKTGYKCSNGHVFVETSIQKCPSCDFGGVISVEEIIL